jgi:hypothetical protein
MSGVNISSKNNFLFFSAKFDSLHELDFKAPTEP